MQQSRARTSLLAFVLSICGISNSVHAQWIEVERINDWEFRYVAYSNALMSAAILAQLASSNNALDYESLVELHSSLHESISETVIYYGGYDFSDAEAQLVSDLALAIVVGLDLQPEDDTDRRIIFGGYELCASGLDAITRR